MSLVLTIISQFAMPAILALLVFWFVRQFIRRKIVGPPGPIGLPFFGYLPFLSFTKKNHVVLGELAREYGDVFVIELGQVKQLVLSSDEAIREAFRQPDFSDRPTNNIFIETLKEAGEKNLVAASGDRWKYSRNLAERGLVLFSSSRDSHLEASVFKVSEWLTAQFAEAKGAPIHTRPMVTQSTAATMLSVLFGADPDPSSKFTTRIIEPVRTFLKIRTNIQMINYFPVTKPFYAAQTTEVIEAMLVYLNPIREQMAQHQSEGRQKTVADAINKAVEETRDEEKRKA